MKIRLVSGLAAGAVLMISGAAFSGGVVAHATTLVNYDQTTRELWALPNGHPLTSYLNQELTVYLPANLALYEPPDPCYPIARAWNLTIAYDAAHQTKSTFVYDVLLTFQANLGCKANVAALTSGTPYPMVAIRPTQ